MPKAFLIRKNISAKELYHSIQWQPVTPPPSPDDDEDQPLNLSSSARSTPSGHGTTIQQQQHHHHYHQIKCEGDHHTIHHPQHAQVLQRILSTHVPDNVSLRQQQQIHYHNPVTQSTQQQSNNTLLGLSNHVHYAIKGTVTVHSFLPLFTCCNLTLLFRHVHFRLFIVFKYLFTYLFSL